MHATLLELTDFRSYASVTLSLHPGINVILGRNGQGKTNLIEAIGYLATLGSHRVATDAPLVRSGAATALLRLQVDAAGRSTLLELAIEPGKAKRARINRSPVPRAAAILGIARVVTFAPEDLALVKGDPTERRRFLDDLLVQQRPLLASTRADYDRVLKQRNALLRSTSVARRSAGSEVDRTLAVWDEQLAELGATLTAARIRLVQDIEQPAVDAYSEISGPSVTEPADSSTNLSLRYVSAVERWLDRPDVPVDLPTEVEPWRAALLSAIADRRREEMDRGVTLVGPQRDDLELRLGDQPAKGYASHGESWSIALALRLACYRLLAATGEDPILVLDDVFAELDARRRSRLVQMVREAEQVIITAAVAEDVPAGLDGHRFEVTTGRVTVGQLTTGVLTEGSVQ
ncbi:MAG: DNA replication/repair protein RecF [Actinomycetales bacterium]